MALSSADNGRVWRMFVSLDKDGDGTIERNELAFAYKKVNGETPTNAELEKLMPEGSDKMDFPSFQTFLSEGTEKDLEELCEQFRLMTHEERLRKRFDELGYHDFRSALEKKENDKKEIDCLFTKLHTAYKIQYKGRQSEGLNAMHIAVDMCEPGESGPVDVLLRRLQGEEEEQKVEYLKQPFPYTGKGDMACKAMAVHLAAATGKKAALLSLIDVAAELVDARALFVENRHATPLHDAAFMQHADIVSELLGKEADATIVDNKGMTALHVVAQQGEDEHTVQKMVSSLLEKGAELGKAVPPTDDFSAALHGKTAFAIAADRTLSKNFPMKALHLLTPHFVEVASGSKARAGTLFHDIKDTADCGLEPGEALARALLDEPYKETAFAQAMDTDTAPDVLNMLAKLTVKLPVLGATLLDALTDTPDVAEAKAHRFPTMVNLSGFMGLAAEPMLCAYEADANEKLEPQWQGTESAPRAWQRKWIDSTKQNSTAQYRVKIQAIHLPNVLDKQMAQALALTPSWCLEIFARKSVQAVVRAGWDQVQYTYYADLIFNILVLPPMLIIGTRHYEGWKPYALCLLLILSVGDTVCLLLVLPAFSQTKRELEKLEERDVQAQSTEKSGDGVRPSRVLSALRQPFDSLCGVLSAFSQTKEGVEEGGAQEEPEETPGSDGSPSGVRPTIPGMVPRARSFFGEAARALSSPTNFARALSSPTNFARAFVSPTNRAVRRALSSLNETLKPKTRFRITWRRWLASSLNWVVDAAAWLPLIVFVLMNFIEQDRGTAKYDVTWRVWLSVTFLLRCWKVMYMLRGQVKSFNAFFSAFSAAKVMNILFFVALCFFMFCGAFVVLTETASKDPPTMLDCFNVCVKDPQTETASEDPPTMLDCFKACVKDPPTETTPKDPPTMLVCVMALLFSEWSGVDVLTMANGKNPVFSTGLTFVCLALFTFCFNNLVTAVFSDQYADDERRSNLIFLSERARLTLKYVYRRQGAGDLQQWARRQGASGLLASRSVGAFFAVLLLSLVLEWNVIGPEATTIGRVCGAVAAVAVIGAATILVVPAIESPLEAATACRRFVWLCYREDFDPDVFQYGPLSDDSCKIERIRQSLDTQAVRSEEVERKMERKMEALQRDADAGKQKMEQLVGGVSTQMVQLERKLDVVLGALEKLQGPPPPP